MHRLVLCCLLAAPLPLGAQWQLTLTSATASIRGDSRNPLGDPPTELRVDHPTIGAFGVSRDVGRWRLGFASRYTAADLSEVGGGTAATNLDAVRAFGISTEGGFRVFGHVGGPSLYALAGATLERWSFSQLDSDRSRGAVQGAVEADLPAGRRWIALIRAEVAAGPSVFSNEEIPEGFTLATHWRSGIGVGVGWRP